MAATSSRARLLARAFRPTPDDPTVVEALYLVVFTSDATDTVLAWTIASGDRVPEPVPGGSWSTDLHAFDPEGNTDPVATSWERIELFAGNALETAGGDLRRAIPRLSFDTIADTIHDDAPAPKIVWTWHEDRRGTVTPQERPDDGAVSKAHDRSCLYVATTARDRRYLVANVRLRSLLSSFGTARGTTWQFVVPLGTRTAFKEEWTWPGPHRDLALRDIFAPVEGITLGATPKGYSYARDLSNDQAQSLALENITVGGERPPTRDLSTALAFNPGDHDDTHGNPVDNVLARVTGGVIGEVAFLKFPTRLWDTSGFTRALLGGLELIDDGAEGGLGVIRLRMYLRIWPTRHFGGTGAFFVPADETLDAILVQEQSPGTAGPRSYEPRRGDRARFVEWRVGILAAEDVSEFVKWWNERVACPLVTSLRAVRDGAPLSFMPSLRPRGRDREITWLVGFVVRDHVSNTMTWPRTGAGPSSTLVPDFDVSSFLVQPAMVDAGVALDVVLEGTGTVEGVAPRFGARLIHTAVKPDESLDAVRGQWALSRSLVAVEGRGVSFGLDVTAPPAGAHHLRVGSLDLALAAVPQDRSLRWSVFGMTRAEPGMGGASCAADAPVARIDARLAVTANPANVDRLFFEDRADVRRALETAGGGEARDIDRRFELDVPIVIDIDGTQSNDICELRALEAVGDQRNHDLAMSLFLLKSDASAVRRIMVIDRTPFGVYLACIPALSSLANAETNEIATWSASGEGGAHWRLAERPEGVEVVLPPQGLGEVMLKGKETLTFPLPFRFTPHARLRIDPSFEQRRYGEVPWNVRRLFGYAEQRAPGSRLTGFDVELLYGLMGHAQGLDDVLIAESEARLGRPVGRQADALPWTPDKLGGNETQESVWRAFRTAWSRRWAQLASRLAVLETYRLDGNEAVIHDGLKWRQRSDAHLKFPLGDDLESVAATRPGVRREFFSKPDGLAGGWSWGFTSLNILEAVLRDPAATSSFVTGLKFSALGGWGYLKASFDEDRTSIYADTVAGRTQMYSLERIGRIGVLWHRAKHVIVYERTVGPSAQFAPDQPEYRGWPILRKVSEYVELLEPDRGFPDSNTEAATRGGVLGVAFKSVRIPVKSEWGEDVRDIGWKVPLWNPREGRTQSTVYPKPHVAFRFAVDPEADVRSVNARCSTPELLYFYTDTRKGTGADSDKWEPILGVDFGISASRPVNGGLDRREHAFQRLDVQLPPEVAVPPGLHHFSFGLEPAERPANLTADRAETAMNASLRNVTLMRSAEVTVPGGAGGAAAVLEAAADMYCAVRTLEQKIKTDYAVTHGLDRPAIEAALRSELTGSVATAIGTLKSKTQAFSAGGASVCDVAKTNAASAFERWKRVLFFAVDSLANEVLVEARIQETALAAGIAQATADLAALRDAIRAARAALDGAVGQVVAVVHRTATSLGAGVLTASQTVVRVEGRALAALDGFDAEVAFLAEDVRKLFAEAQARLDDCIAEANTVPWTSVERWFATAADLRTRLRTIAQQVNEALEKADRTVASQGERLGGIFQAPLRALREVRGVVTLAVRTMDEALAWILAQQTHAQEFRESIVQRLQTVKAAAATLQTKVERAIADAQNAILGTSDQARRAVEAGADTAKQWIDGHVGRAITLAEDSLTAGLNGFRDALDELLVLPDAELEREIGSALASIRRGDYFSLPLEQAIAAARKEMDGDLAPLQAALTQHVDDLCRLITAPLADWLTNAQAMDALIAEARNRLASAVDLDEVREALERTADQIVGDAAAVFEQARRAIEDSPVGPVLQQPDRAIRLLRAFGDPPQVPKLDFNRASTAFLFGNPKDAIDITPVTAWFDQVGDDLKALGIRLPADKLLDRLLPIDLTRFDVSKLLPDFAGLKLDRLLPGLRAPASAGEGIRVTHGLDKQRQRAWAEATVAVQLSGGAELFAFGPLALTLLEAKFDAAARLETGLDGRVERRAHGTITGDWRMDFGGQTLVTFRRTTLSFDETGQTRFDLSPDRMEMAAALRYLTDLARKVQYEDGGFVFRLLERNGIPYGAEALFEIALPPLQYGTTGLIGATIGAAARLVAYPDFAIELGMHVSRKDSPFVFSVFILGGAGYVEANALYLPLKNALSVDVSIGLAASASLAFAFGPISGQVAVMIGVAVEYHRRPGQGGGGLAMSLRLLVMGRVDVLRIVTVHVALALEATYHEGGRITARGSLSVTIRISSFFKISVSVTVSYDFSSGKSVSESQTNVQAHPALGAARKLASTAA